MYNNVLLHCSCHYFTSTCYKLYSMLLICFILSGFSSLRAGITKYYRLSGSNNRKLIFSQMEAIKSEMKVLAGLIFFFFFPEASLCVSYLDGLIFSICLHIVVLCVCVPIFSFKNISHIRLGPTLIISF